MYGKKFLRHWLRHSLAKLCTKNYENPSIFVKVTAKKSVAPFSPGHGVYRYIYIHLYSPKTVAIIQLQQNKQLKSLINYTVIQPIYNAWHENLEHFATIYHTFSIGLKLFTISIWHTIFWWFWYCFYNFSIRFLRRVLDIAKQKNSWHSLTISILLVGPMKQFHKESVDDKV